MIKRLLSIVIIFSMILHCSSRLGLISFVYKNRFEIGESLGLTKEKHITTCDSHYFNDRDLHIADADSKADLPLNLNQAHEINLFQVVDNSIHFDVQTGESIEANFPVPSNLSEAYSKAIFHPPLS